MCGKEVLKTKTHPARVVNNSLPNQGCLSYALSPSAKRGIYIMPAIHELERPHLPDLVIYLEYAREAVIAVDPVIVQLLLGLIQELKFKPPKRL